MDRLKVILSLILILIINGCSSQNFDPEVDDQVYLDRIQKRLNEEAMEAYQILVNQTEVLLPVTREFVKMKIQENLFKMVRVRVEEELEDMTKNNVTLSLPNFRQARQDEDEEDEEGEVTATSRPRVNQVGLLPHLANIVSTFVGIQQGLITPPMKPPLNLFSRPIPGSSVPNSIPLSQFHPQSNAQQVPSSPGLNQAGQSILSQQSDYQLKYQLRQQAIQQYVNQIRQQQQQQKNNLGAGLQQLQPAVNNGVYLQQQLQQQQQQNQPIIITHFLPPANNGNGVSSTTPLPATTSKATSKEDEDNSGEAVSGSNGGGTNALNEEDDSPEFEGRPPSFDDLASDDKLGKQDKKNGTASTSIVSGYLEKYPAINYAYRLFNRLTDRGTGNTSSPGYTNGTLKSTDPLNEDKMVATTPSTRTRTVSRIVQGGTVVYEGAREGIQLLQHLNKFLDRVNDRFETAGYGAADIGIAGAGGDADGDERKDKKGRK